MKKLFLSTQYKKDYKKYTPIIIFIIKQEKRENIFISPFS